MLRTVRYTSALLLDRGAQCDLPPHLVVRVKCNFCVVLRGLDGANVIAFAITKFE